MDTSDVRKILAVWPGAYSLQWERHSLNDYDMELKLMFTADSEKHRLLPPTKKKVQLDERKAEFERHLLAFAKQRHSLLMKEVGEPGFDPERARKWHPAFDLDIEEVSQAPLPAKPVLTSQISMKKIMDMNNEKLMDMVYKVKQSIQKESMSDTEDNRHLAGNRLIAIVDYS